MVAALEMRTRILEARAPFLVDQPGCRIGKRTVGIAQRLAALSLEMKRPARPETLEDIVRARAGRDQLRFGRAFEVRPRSEERRVGQERVNTCSVRGAHAH